MEITDLWTYGFLDSSLWASFLVARHAILACFNIYLIKLTREFISSSPFHYFKLSSSQLTFGSFPLDQIDCNDLLNLSIEINSIDSLKHNQLTAVVVCRRRVLFQVGALAL